MLESWEKLLDNPLATLCRGRGAELTDLGEKLLWVQNRISTRLVASGSADAGFGIAAAAAEMNLDFLPLINESYYFCMPQTLKKTPTVQALLSLLHSREFRDAVNRLSGYDPGAAGDIVSVDVFLATGR